jgi:hypothetical protein
VDLFAYPWPWADNSYDGALLSHIAEHIPHEIRYANEPVFCPGAREDEVRRWMEWNGKQVALRSLYQDGWYAFFSELYRVLTPGAIVHILSPYGWSQGAITDPTHTRLLTEHTFTNSMAPDEDSPFKYETGGIHFEMAQPEVFHVTDLFEHLKDDPVEFTRALRTRLNVAYEIYVQLRAVKE